MTARWFLPIDPTREKCDDGDYLRYVMPRLQWSLGSSCTLDNVPLLLNLMSSRAVASRR
jgi:hypothetical protein